MSSTTVASADKAGADMHKGNKDDSGTARAQPRRDVWLSIVDEATARVVEFLVAAQRPLDVDAPLMRDMLQLVDRHTLHDIAHERNGGGRCARPGCAHVPRQVHYRDANDGDVVAVAAAATAQAAGVVVARAQLPRHYDGDSDSDSDSNDGDDALLTPAAATLAVSAPPPRHGGSAAAAAAAGGAAAADDGDAIVYDDDVYAHESFRLAMRQQQQLARLRAKARRARNAQRAHTTTRTTTTTTDKADDGDAAVAVVYRGLRFCSSECVDSYRSELRARVLRVRDYTHARLLPALTNLFPAISRELLRRATTADATSLGACGVRDCVVEHDEAAPSRADDTKEEAQERHAAQQQQPQQHTDKHNSGSKGDVAATEADCLRSVLQRMQVLEHVWRAETAATHRDVSADDSATTTTAAAAVVVQHASAQRPQQAAHGMRQTRVVGPRDGETRLRGVLFVLDLCMNMGSERTYGGFVRRYAMQYAAMRSCVAQCRSLVLLEKDTTTATTKTSSRAFASHDANAAARAAVLLRMTGPTLRALDAAATRWRRRRDDGTRPAARNEGDEVDEDDGSGEAVGVAAQRQRQRRELFLSRVCGSDVTQTLSRLLLFDAEVLVTHVWQRVWCTPCTAIKTYSSSSNNVDNNNNSENTAARVVALPALVETLQMTTALPTALLRPARGSVELLTLGLVFVLAAACVSPTVWRHMTSDGDVDAAALLRAMAVSEDDVAAAVHALVVNVYEDDA